MKYVNVLAVSALIQFYSPQASSFFVSHQSLKRSQYLYSTPSPTIETSKTWQEELDEVLNVDTPCEGRREISINILKRASEITADVTAAIQDQDIEKLAPRKLSYGKALLGLQAFQKQLVNDIIPDFLTKAVPKLIDETPKILSALSEKGPTEISNDLIKKGQEVVTKARDISQDPSMLQSTIDDLRRELKNVVRSTPTGIDEPSFTVIKTVEDSYEIRQYEGYSVCSIVANSADSTTTSSTSSSLDASSDTPIMDIVSSSKSFNTLASYIFGENANEQKLSMTTPVILESKDGNGVMSFVLPRGVNAFTAPFPTSEKIALRDVSSGSVVAVRSFTGIATEGEVSRQKAKLEEALKGDGVQYDSASFKVLQYNPPYTVPWVRRNEVSFAVTLSEDLLPPPNAFKSEDASTFFSSPEAGD